MPGFVVVNRQWLVSGLVEPRRVAEHVELEEAGQARECDVCMFFDTAVEETVAFRGIGGDCAVGFLREAVCVEDLGDCGRSQENTCTTISHWDFVFREPVCSFGEGAYIIGFLGVVGGESFEEGSGGREESVIIHDCEIVSLRARGILPHHPYQVHIPSLHVEVLVCVNY